MDFLYNLMMGILKCDYEMDVKIMSERRISGKGQGLVEYGLILALVVLLVIIIMASFGEKVTETYCGMLIDMGMVSGECAGRQSSYCEDNFKNLNGWEFTRHGEDRWQEINGQMCMTTSSYRDHAYSTCSKSMPSDDYVIKLNGVELSQGPGYGVFFRLQDYDDRPSGYVFQYDKGAQGFVFRRWTDGNESTIAYKHMGSGYDWYDVSRDIEIHVNGNQFEAYVDGELVLTATDSAYTSGGMGFRTWGTTNVCFSDMGLNEVEAEE